MITETKKTYEYDRRIAAIHRLRVHIKSLAYEAMAIRKEERRCGYQYLAELQQHRRGPLRDDARYAQLAIAFFRKRPYRSVENEGSKTVFWARLLAKANRFVDGTTAEEIRQWLGCRW